MLCPVPQAFINTSFENITSTEHALSLLAQFNAILQRDKLKEELDAKYQVGAGWQHSPTARGGMLRMQ